MKLSDVNQRPEAFILVGLPGSGKSTWIRTAMNRDDYAVISSDDEIEKYAQSKGLTYSDVFQDYVKTATVKMNKNFDDAVKANRNIIWDQTNLTPKKRKSILQKLPKQYRKIAVVFTVDPDELQRRLDRRAQEEGKHIPQHIMTSMKSTFQMPTKDEGFHEIITV